MDDNSHITAHRAKAPVIFAGRERVSMRAIFLAQRLNLKTLEKSQRLASSPFVMNVGIDGYAVLFKYGVVVLFGMDPIEEAAFVENLKLFALEPLDRPETEAVEIIADENQPDGLETDYIRLRHWSIEHIQTIADIFAKSAVLSYYEARMADIFDRIEPAAAQLRHGAPKEQHARNLLTHIGDTLSIQRKMIGQVEIDDKPDMLWDRPDLERLYMRLYDEYELRERHGALKEKLDMVYRTAETMLGMLQDKRTLRMERYILLLLGFLILMTMLDKIVQFVVM